MATLKQSTAYTRTFLMVDSSDHLSPKTGLTVGVYLSKAGGAFGAVSGSVSEISFGWYKAALNATDTNTLGDLAYHCTGSAADLTDFVDDVKANVLGDTIPANVTQWLGVAPNALISGTVDGFQHYPVTQDANLVTWKGTAPNNLISGTVDAFSHYANPTQAYLTGTVDVNVTLWRGTQPNTLVSGTVDGFAHYANTLPANVIQWNGTTPNNLVSGTVDAFAHYANTVSANVTQWQGISPNNLISGTVDSYQHYPVTQDANVVSWRGATPNALISGTVDAYEHYGNPIQSYPTGTVNANLIQIDGQATNGNNATLNLKKLTVINSNSNAVEMRVVSGSGVGLYLQGGGTEEGIFCIGGDFDAAGAVIRGGNTNGMGLSLEGMGLGYGALVQGGNNASGIGVIGSGVNGFGLDIFSNQTDAISAISNGFGKSINAPQGIFGDIVGNITGSLTGNVYGDIHGYVGWVTGSVQNVLVSTPAAPPTGTVNANVIQWVGDTPNLLISGTVDAFSHYSNPVQAYVTGTVDANVVEVNSDISAAVSLQKWLDLFIFGKVSDVTPANNSFDTDLSSGVDGFYRDRILMFTTGALAGQGATIYSYIGLSKTLFFDEPFTSAPANNDDFVLLPSHMHPITQIGDYAALLTWSNALPGAYAAGQAGYIVGTNLDDAISNVPTANENADALLKRDWTAVTGEASRSVLNALRFIRNKFSTTAHANKVTIYKEDDTAEAYQKDVTTDATADPIVEG